jgi:hypothetical protein
MIHLLLKKVEDEKNLYLLINNIFGIIAKKTNKNYDEIIDDLLKLRVEKNF